MDRREKAWVVGLLSLLGAIALFALAVYPFQYGFVESTLLVGGFIAFMLFKTVLDDTSF